VENKKVPIHHQLSLNFGNEVIDQVLANPKIIFKLVFYRIQLVDVVRGKVLLKQAQRIVQHCFLFCELLKIFLKGRNFLSVTRCRPRSLPYIDVDLLQ
jgi:hypothetical protein